jgi:hydroxymethylglutaryl-CoA lyase/(R)-citramalyl-CoA lyase
MTGARVIVCDVGPRDGLQNEEVTLSPAVRAELVQRLATTGVPRIEVASFAHPDRVPQMAGAEDLIAMLDPVPGVTYAGLVLNERGYDRALRTELEELHYVLPVTESFCRRNQRTTVAEATEVATRLAARAQADARRFTTTLAVAFGCPFEGLVDPAEVLELTRLLVDHGVDEVVLADTIGVAVPTQVTALVAGAVQTGAAIGIHLHNTRNTGYANAVAAIAAGATVVDASVGGTGGCPFAPGATGNVATEDLVYLLEGMGHGTGIDLQRMTECAAWLGEALGRDLPGLLHRVGPFPPPNTTEAST